MVRSLCVGPHLVPPEPVPKSYEESKSPTGASCVCSDHYRFEQFAHSSLFTGHCSLWFVVCALCFVDWCYSSCACSDHYRFVQFAHSSLFTVDCSLCFVICALYNVDRCYCYSACSDHYRFVRMSPAALLVPLRSLHVPVLVSTLTAWPRKGVSGRWFCVISRYFQSLRGIPSSLDVAYPVFYQCHQVKRQRTLSPLSWV